MQMANDEKNLKPEISEERGKDGLYKVNWVVKEVKEAIERPRYRRDRPNCRPRRFQKRRERGGRCPI